MNDLNLNNIEKIYTTNNRKNIRDIIKLLTKEENDNYTDDVNTASYYDIGVVMFKYNGKEENIILSISNDVFYSNYSMVLFAVGDIRVIIHEKELSTMYSVFIGRIAHEIGHYLAGHNQTEYARNFPTAFKLYGLPKRQRSSWVDINKEKQQRIAKTFKQDTYIRTTACSLLRGGVLDIELEADIKAVELIGIESILLAHATDLNYNNITTILEKTNRVKRLKDMYEAKEINRNMDNHIYISFYEIDNT